VTTRAFSAVAGFLGLCLPLLAQQTDRSASALNNNSLRFPSLTLADGGHFPFASAFNRMETRTPDFLPFLSMANMTARSQKAARPAVQDEDSSKEGVDVRRPLFDYATGEVGFLYGRSSGIFGREVEQGYILGEVGNDKFQISAGAAYEHSSGHVPRFGR
jgi:hypothetical protein